jgi:hypothetical protein
MEPVASTDGESWEYVDVDTDDESSEVLGATVARVSTPPSPAAVAVE